MEKLEKKVIGIAGVGGLGSNVAMSLARIGVKNILIVDFDKVEESNLNRQYYFKKDIGKYKVNALKENIYSIGKNINIKTYVEKIHEKNIEFLFGKVDILIEALDNPETKAMLVNKFLKLYSDKPVIAASGISGFNSSNLIVTKRITKNLYIVGDGRESEEHTIQDIFLAPRVIIAANHQANMALRLIMDEEEV